jgi:hypothetical protein
LALGFEPRTLRGVPPSPPIGCRGEVLLFVRVTGRRLVQNLENTPVTPKIVLCKGLSGEGCRGFRPGSLLLSFPIYFLFYQVCQEGGWGSMGLVVWFEWVGGSKKIIVLTVTVTPARMGGSCGCGDGGGAVDSGRGRGRQFSRSGCACTPSPSTALRAERLRLRRGLLRHPSAALRTGSEAVPSTKKRPEVRRGGG